MAVAPYPSLEAVVEAARIKLNDAVIPGGEVLTDTASFTIDYINLAWQKCQQYLVSLGLETLIDYVTITNLAVAGTADAGIPVSLSWTGYNNGSGVDATVVLPQNLIRPIALWERANGGTGKFYSMDEILNGLPPIPKGTAQDSWEWVADTLRMIGATVATDILIRYMKYFSDFVAAGTTPFANQPVPILRSLDTFSGYVAYEMASGRGDVDMASLMADAKEAAMMVVAPDSIIYRDTQKVSERSKMRDRYTPPGSGGPQ